jgi:hypothetical protein
MSMSANIKLMISQAPIVACFHLKVRDDFRSLNEYSVLLAFSIYKKISIKNA